ncbi:MAG TPA: AAA family ATPase [Myxococcota bacterium]|nr:AAA family ATPase [Myxococcota bacterium]
MAARSKEIRFGRFRLELPEGALYDGDEPVALQPRPLAVLRYLAQRPGRLVPGDELLREVWQGTVVTRGVLKVAVRAVREALGEEATAPRYVETVGRKGYRFLGEAEAAREGAAELSRAPHASLVVGRDTDLEQLRAAFRESLDGTRRIVLVAGEAGIGKTTLLDRFLGELETRADVLVARGQCLERHGEGEPYLPVLEALGRVCRESGAARLAAALRRHAPGWVEQLPGLAEASGTQGAEESGSTAERMVRELADALAVATADHPVVLALEDLHWSDHATLDVLSCLAQRREPAQLLVVGSYRPSEVIVYGHPLRDLKQQLVAKSQCEELVLEPLAERDVAEYLRLRLGEAPDRLPLAAALHARTAGTPLFVAGVVDELLENALVVRDPGGWRLAVSADQAAESIPEGVQQLIEQQADRLSPEDRRLLDAASVAGVEFSVASVAAALELALPGAEEACEALAARGAFLQPAGLSEWPDGTLSGRYRFRHPLRSHVLYRRIADSRRVRLHRALAAREEVGYGARAGEIAAQLATHFERGHDWARAAKYHEAAGHTALRCHAPREAAAHFERALLLLERLAPSRSRTEAELALRVALAAPLMALRGYAAPEVGASYDRARTLCKFLGAERELLPVLRGLTSHHQVRGELGVARALGEELLARAAAAGDPVAQVQAHYGHGVTLFHSGAPAPARPHFERALELYRKEQHAEHARRYGGYDPGVACRVWLGWALQVLGLADEAKASAAAGLALAQELGHPLTLAFAHYGTGLVHQTAGEWAEALRLADESSRLAEEYGFAQELAFAKVMRGWGLVLQGRLEEGRADLGRGLELYAATGGRLPATSNLLLAAAEVMSGRLDEAHRIVRAVLDESKGREHGLYTVELACGAARVLLAVAPTKPADERRSLEREAEGLLESALATAREQHAPSLELMAATGLARRRLDSGRRDDARELLAPLVARLSGGRETRDLRRAVKLLAEIESPGQPDGRRGRR